MATINLTGTIVDSTSQAWAQAIITARLVGFASPQGLPRDIAAPTVPIPIVYETVAGDDGSFSLTVESNATIDIPNTGYEIFVQPNATTFPTVVCAQNKFIANTDISTLINNVIKTPAIECLPFQRAYAEDNIIGPFQGAVYVNTGAGATAGFSLWMYDGVAWIKIGGGGGGGGITGLNVDVLAGVSPFTASECVMVHASDSPNFLTIDSTGGDLGDILALMYKDGAGNTLSIVNDSAAVGQPAIIFTDDLDADGALIFGDSGTLHFQATTNVLFTLLDNSSTLTLATSGSNFSLETEVGVPFSIGSGAGSGAGITFNSSTALLSGLVALTPAAPNVASISGINLPSNNPVIRVTGVATIHDILNNGGATPVDGQLLFIQALGAWSMAGGGNIFSAFTAVVGSLYIGIFNATSNGWFFTTS